MANATTLRPWTNIVGLSGPHRTERRWWWWPVAALGAVSSSCSLTSNGLNAAPSSMFWLSIILRQFVTVRPNPLASSFICFILCASHYCCHYYSCEHHLSDRTYFDICSALYLPFSDSNTRTQALTLTMSSIAIPWPSGSQKNFQLIQDRLAAPSNLDLIFRGLSNRG